MTIELPDLYNSRSVTMKKPEDLKAEGKKVIKDLDEKIGKHKAAAIEKVKHLMAKFDISVDHLRSALTEKPKAKGSKPPAKKVAKTAVKKAEAKSSAKTTPEQPKQKPVKKTPKKAAKS